VRGGVVRSCLIPLMLCGAGSYHNTAHRVVTR
jgi:hypothetical protein